MTVKLPRASQPSVSTKNKTKFALPFKLAPGVQNSSKQPEQLGLNKKTGNATNASKQKVNTNSLVLTNHFAAMPVSKSTSNTP